MNSELVAVGTEILLGNITNSHARYLSNQLAELGINVLYHTAVGDNRERLREVVEMAFCRSDLIVFTGGLGPTKDDLTKEIVCQVLGIPLVEDAETEQRIETYFERLRREMPENNRKQAMVPAGAKLFPNENGTAPGIAVQHQGKCILLLPGPPQELIPMYQNQVRPFLSRFSSSTIRSRNLRIYGLGESKVDELLGEILDQENPTVALYAKEGEVLARITAKADVTQRCEQMIGKTEKQIREILGDFIYGVDVDSLEEQLVKELLERHRSLALAESCTGGLVAQKITSIPGASGCFQYGIVSYSNQVKESQLGVSSGTLEQYGAVSPQVAREMAEHARRNGGADIGIGITGIAGPDGGTPEKPVGLVYIGVATNRTLKAVECRLGRGLPDERASIRNRASLKALSLALEALHQED